MKIEEKFNKRSAALIDVQPPTIHTGHGFSLGIKATFYPLPGSPESGSAISMHMTPDEAMQLAASLIEAARRALRK